jgi:hypothetical protein
MASEARVIINLSEQRAYLVEQGTEEWSNQMQLPAVMYSRAAIIDPRRCRTLFAVKSKTLIGQHSEMPQH